MGGEKWQVAGCRQVHPRLRREGSADPSHCTDRGIEYLFSRSVVPIVGESEVRQPPQESRPPSPGATAFSELTRVVECADAPAADARRSAQRSGAPSPNALAGDSCDLVARALAILANETEAWRVGQKANLSPRSIR